MTYERTFQDFEIEKARGRITDFLREVINAHKDSEALKIALDADAYDHRENITIRKFEKKLFTTNGHKVADYTSSNMKVCSNFFNILNTQRVSYSLGNGVTFSDTKIKDKLGIDFDTVLKKAARYALIHGVSFLFFNNDHCHLFKLTEFVPLYDEATGMLRAGVRYYQIDQRKPLTCVLYEEDGYTTYRTKNRGDKLYEIEPKRAYKQIVSYSVAEGETVIGEENYGALPIVPLWGSDLKQSTLIGMREQIDSYDLIRSGFANDLLDCAQIYWIVSGFMGMTDSELSQFRDRLLFNHIALADTDNGTVTPYTQQIPFEARTGYLTQIRKQIYDDFGALDVTNFASGTKTATEIQAAYQPMDDMADDFEYQIIQAVQQILKLLGMEDTPIFKRNKLTNPLEQVQMVIQEAEYLDDRTILEKLPNITPDEVEEILKRKDAEDANRMAQFDTGNQQENEEDEDETEE